MSVRKQKLAAITERTTLMEEHATRVVKQKLEAISEHAVLMDKHSINAVNFVSQQDQLIQDQIMGKLDTDSSYKYPRSEHTPKDKIRTSKDLTESEESDATYDDEDLPISPENFLQKSLIINETRSQTVPVNLTNIFLTTSTELDKKAGPNTSLATMNKRTYIARDIAEEALKTYRMRVLTNEKLIYNDVDVLDFIYSKEIEKGPLSIGVINLYNQTYTSG